jgi:hypothetical protein
MGMPVAVPHIGPCRPNVGAAFRPTSSVWREIGNWGRKRTPRSEFAPCVVSPTGGSGVSKVGGAPGPECLRKWSQGPLDRPQQCESAARQGPASCVLMPRRKLYAAMMPAPAAVSTRQEADASKAQVARPEWRILQMDNVTTRLSCDVRLTGTSGRSMSCWARRPCPIFGVPTHAITRADVISALGAGK